MTVHYEVYVGLPLISKWISVALKSASRDDGVRVKMVAVENVATNWQWSQQGSNPQLQFSLFLFSRGYGNMIFQCLIWAQIADIVG